MIKEKEKLLFKSWKEERSYTSFWEDGLFDEEEWNKQTIKILYVLKEANWENGNGDLCDYLLSEKSSNYWRTWNNIVRWTQAIRYGSKYQKHITKADKTKCLRTIAALNMKKVGGDASANDEEIRDFGKRDAKFINQQIELYQPDIIVCCGRGTGKNADILHDYVLTSASEWQEPIETYYYFLCTLESGKTIPVLSFRHPQIRGGHTVFEKTYNDMLTVVEELRSRKHLKSLEEE